ncbi:MAG TPA: phytanoyl-CoA dioxygenase family protein [Roseiarcus sp.]|nr:phytanoyl-CoA dioxygenase family protein [Roseiarcus sp.]
MPGQRAKFRVTESQKRQFVEDGYCIFEDVVSDELVALLRQECAHFVRREDTKMDALGVDQIGITHRGKRYHAAFCFRERAALGKYLFSEAMGEICRALVGPDTFLFFDGFVVKGAEAGMKLAWHQDSGYVNAVDGDIGHKPYITCWCPLDDVTEENGTIYVLPMSESGIKTCVLHEFDPLSNDWVGYFGPLKGTPVIAKAGSLAVFSSLTMHSSGANTTPRLRRAFISQYSPEPVLTADGAMLWANAVPFLKDGRSVVGTSGPDKPHRIDLLSNANEKLDANRERTLQS